jgi:hypothetical protein
MSRLSDWDTDGPIRSLTLCFLLLSPEIALDYVKTVTC